MSYPTQTAAAGTSSLPTQAGPTPTHSTQAEAQAAARAIVHNQGGGEVVTHRPNGQIRDSDTIAPGHDPFPLRDKK